MGNNGGGWFAKFGTHPNEKGCSVWAHALYQQMNQIIVDDCKS